MDESESSETPDRRADLSERDGARCSLWLDGIEDGCGCVEIWERLSERRRR